MWFVLVHVVQTTGHISTDGDHLPSAQFSLLQLFTQAGGHQLSEDHWSPLPGSTNEQKQVWMAQLGSNGYLMSEKLNVVYIQR